MAMTGRAETNDHVVQDIIALQGIGKSYPHSGSTRDARVPVLHDIDLRIAPGTILGLLGPNGAGKTTLIKILAGLLRPDSGGGTVLGYDLLRQHAEVRARVSLVAPTADVGIDNNLTVRQNLTFWAPIYGLRGEHARARIDELLAKLGLVEKADAWPMHISAGQRQRLALARSLLAENRLVFLDEPTNKLDLDGVRSVRQMIADLNREQGATIVFTTHVMEEAEELCGQIALLRQGELVAHQPTRELTRSLNVARPITMTVQCPEPALWPHGRSPSGATEHDWEHQLRELPGAIGIANVVQRGLVATLTVESLDLRATTPALLSWTREQGLTLVSMRAEPVTLGDVFAALTRREPMSARGEEC
jgi:ABC-2 type transport system ATP-binding protein